MVGIFSTSDQNYIVRCSRFLNLNSSPVIEEKASYYTLKSFLTLLLFTSPFLTLLNCWAILFIFSSSSFIHLSEHSFRISTNKSAIFPVDIRKYNFSVSICYIQEWYFRVSCGRGRFRSEQTNRHIAKVHSAKLWEYTRHYETWLLVWHRWRPKQLAIGKLRTKGF